MAFGICLFLSSGRCRTLLLFRDRRRPDVFDRNRCWFLRLWLGLSRTAFFQRLPRDQQLNFSCIQRFPFEKSFGNPDQGVTMSRQQVLRAFISPDYQPSHFLIDRNGRALAVIAMLRDLASQEYLFFLFAER